MDIYTLCEMDEDHPIYQQLSAANAGRHYEFLHSMIGAAVAMKHPLFSHSLMRAINSHAIGGLHHAAGQYRPIPVTVGQYRPPPPCQVEPLMRAFVTEVQDKWEDLDSVKLGAFALWRINFIHPFVNGNGRTARAICYFILSVKAGGALPGTLILPERLRQERLERPRYIQSLQAADSGDLEPLTGLLQGLLATSDLVLLS